MQSKVTTNCDNSSGTEYKNVVLSGYILKKQKRVLIKSGMRKVSLVAIHPDADYACNEVSARQVCGGPV